MEAEKEKASRRGARARLKKRRLMKILIRNFDRDQSRPCAAKALKTTFRIGLSGRRPVISFSAMGCTSRANLSLQARSVVLGAPHLLRSCAAPSISNAITASTAAQRRQARKKSHSFYQALRQATKTAPGRGPNSALAHIAVNCAAAGSCIWLARFVQFAKGQKTATNGTRQSAAGAKNIEGGNT